jgi:hypothetical protein
LRSLKLACLDVSTLRLLRDADRFPWLSDLEIVQMSSNESPAELILGAHRLSPQCAIALNEFIMKRPNVAIHGLRALPDVEDMESVRAVARTIDEIALEVSCSNTVSILTKSVSVKHRVRAYKRTTSR